MGGSADSGTASRASGARWPSKARASSAATASSAARASDPTLGEASAAAGLNVAVTEALGRVLTVLTVLTVLGVLGVRIRLGVRRLPLTVAAPTGPRQGAFAHALAHALAHAFTHTFAHAFTHTLAHTLAHPLAHFLAKLAIRKTRRLGGQPLRGL